MASPLPLQLTNPVGYVDNSGSLSDYLISDAILQRNAEHSPFHSALSDFEFVDQPYRQCPRIGSRGRAERSHSVPALPDDLLEHPALVHAVLELASHLQVRSHFHDPTIAAGAPTTKD
ncbi:hypothetical protein evm_004821 [Chilo suppressalis]|nr:hypothetical protein evm_004821 [Chilo suppressalis]